MKTNIVNKTFIFYTDQKKTKSFTKTYDELIALSQDLFIMVLKGLNIDNELRAEHKPDDTSKKTLYEKYLDIHKGIDESEIDTVAFEMVESMYIETLRTLDIDNKLSDSEKYEPKRYDNQKMSLYEKIEVKKIMEPNLWNRFDDYSRLAFEQYDFNENYAYQWYNYQQELIDFFIEHIMFYWGDGVGLPAELNPITPHLTDRFIGDMEKKKKKK